LDFATVAACVLCAWSASIEVSRIRRAQGDRTIMDEHRTRGAERAKRRLRYAGPIAVSSQSAGGRIPTSMKPLLPAIAADVTRRELHARVLGFVARRVDSREDAEDIAQEVMLRIHRHSAELEHAERMLAWVYRIAANAIADHYRRPARRELPSGQAADVPEPDHEPLTPVWEETGPDALRQELAACLAPLIERLPPLYRHAVELTELGGLSQVEAAAQLGLSVSGMKARVQRARGQLRELLLECCHIELDRRRAVTDVRARGAACGTCGAPLARTSA
jgi:RNA polymerase sigma-70 factor (ECF subfamily)